MYHADRSEEKRYLPCGGSEENSELQRNEWAKRAWPREQSIDVRATTETALTYREKTGTIG